MISFEIGNKFISDNNGTPAIIILNVQNLVKNENQNLIKQTAEPELNCNVAVYIHYIIKTKVKLFRQNCRYFRYYPLKL